ncbi:hypothetical protein [Streptomyces sp. NPDC056817]|uniref:hypothetical protein n=1 Tax=Streptomyces sp. NPDC056817 TaxID=3345950 RepID=UPI00367E5A5E
MVDAVLAAVDVAAVVFTVRGTFARRHVLAEARRHLLETLRGRPIPPGVDDYIADQALFRHGRHLTVPQPGHRSPALERAAHLHRRLRPAGPLVIAGTDGKPPRASTRYERALVAGLALQNAIRAAPAAARDEVPSAATGAHAEDHHHDQAAAAPHAVDHPGRDAALTRPAGRRRPRPPAGGDAGAAGRPHDR